MLRGKRAGKGPGLLQTVGQPLHAGEVFTVAGKGTARTVLLLDLARGFDRFRGTIQLRDLPVSRPAVVRIQFVNGTFVFRVGGKRLPAALEHRLISGEGDQQGNAQGHAERSRDDRECLTSERRACQDEHRDCRNQRCYGETYANQEVEPDVLVIMGVRESPAEEA